MPCLIVSRLQHDERWIKDSISGQRGMLQNNYTIKPAQRQGKRRKPGKLGRSLRGSVGQNGDFLSGRSLARSSWSAVGFFLGKENVLLFPHLTHV